MQLYIVPEEVFFVVRILYEVQSSLGRVSLAVRKVLLFPSSRVCDEGAHEEFLVKVGETGLRDLYPRSF